MGLIYFPTLASGARAQYPLTVDSSFNNLNNDLDNGGRISFSYRTNPLCRWNLVYSSLNDADVGTLEAFFNSMFGKFGSFVFLCPIGNLIPNTISMSDGSSDPWNTGTGTHASSLSAVVLPSDANGIQLCVSIYVYPYATESFTIGFNGANTVTTAIAGRWTRLVHSGVVSGAGTVTATFSGPGSTLVAGFMCSPTVGPNSWQATPGVGYGFHQNCRFDTDTFSVKYNGIRSSSVTLPIVEIGS